jgi:hypothetical protein
MAFCIPLVEEKIRAELWFGNNIVAKTPYILSFNVQKSRTQTSNTFNITVEILAGVSFPLNGKIMIKAGLRGNLKDIFTGVIKQVRSEPSFGKPNYYKLTISGEGILADLEGKKFTRRLRTDGQGLFCLITGGPSNRPDAGYALDGSKTAGNRQFLSPSYDPTKKAGAGENSPLIVNPTSNSSGVRSTTAAGGLAVEPKDSSNKDSSGLTIHTHEDMAQGGPAFGVFSAD